MIRTTRLLYQLTPLNIENKELEQVKSFKYFWSIINIDNTVEEEIKERIALGNKVYFANKKDVSKQAHIKKGKVETILFGD